MVAFKTSEPHDIQDKGLNIYAYGDAVYLVDEDGQDLPEYVEIFTIAGQRVFSVNLKSNVRNILKPSLKSGIYLVKVRTGSEIHSEKVLLQ
jgi:hypothetical protein